MQPPVRLPAASTVRTKPATIPAAMPASKRPISRAGQAAGRAVPPDIAMIVQGADPNAMADFLEAMAKLLGIMLAPLTSFAINLGALAKKRAEEEGAAA